MSTSPRRALFWSLAERYAGLMISIASTMLLSRLLTPGQVGIYSMCAAFTAVAGILRDFGVSEYLIQEKDLTRDKVRSAYTVAFIVAWSIGAVAFFSRHWLADFYAEPRVADVMLVLTLHFLLLPISSPTFALMNRELAFRQIFFMQMACNAAQAITSVGLAFLGFGVLSLAWGPVVGVLVQTAILFFLRPGDIAVLPGLTQLRHVLRFGSMYVTSRTLEVLSRNFHEPVIAKQFDFASVGLFSRAFGLIDLFHSNVGAAVIRVATPAFAQTHRSGLPLVEPYARATAIFTSVSWTFFGFVGLMAAPIIELMFGSQWVAAAPIASVLAVAVMPSNLYALAPQMLAATGHIARRLKTTLIVSPIHVVLVVLMAQISLLAVAATWLLSLSLTHVLYLRHVRHVLQASNRDILGPCLASAAVAAASIATMATVKWMLLAAGLGLLLDIAAVLLAGALAWWGAARLLEHPAHAELLKLYRDWRTKK